MANYINRLRQGQIFDNFGRMPNVFNSDLDPSLDPMQNITFGTDQPPPPNFGNPEIDFGVDVDFTQQPRSMVEDIPKLQEKDWFTRLQEEYKPKTEATGRFNELLGQYPEREEPSFARKLVAGGMGLDARQRVGTPGQEFTARGNPLPTMEGVMYAPHMRDVSDWKEKAGPYYNAANLERQENIQERQLIGQGVQAEIQNKRLDETERHNRRREESERIRALAYRAKNEGYKIDTYGDRIMGFKPDGTSIDLGPSGDMDQRDLEILKGGYQVQAAEARGRAAVNVANIRGERTYQELETGKIYYGGGNRMQLEDAQGNPVTPRGTIREITGSVPRTSEDRPEDTAKIRNNKLQTFYDDPRYREFIEPATTQGGSWQLKPPETRRWYQGGGQDPEKMKIYNELLQKMGVQAGQTEAPAPPQVKSEATQGIGPTQVPVSPFETGQQLQRRRAAQHANPLVQGPFQPNATASEVFNLPAPQVTGSASEQRQRQNEVITVQQQIEKEGLPPGTIVEKNKATGEYRISVDDGKTWGPYRPPSGVQ